MILSDTELETMKETRAQNKRAIKDAGFKVCVVKRKYRLFDASGNMVEEIPSFYSTFEIFDKFANIVKKAGVI